MSQTADSVAGLADRLIEARRSGAKLSAEAVAGLVPVDVATADAVQIAVAGRLG